MQELLRHVRVLAEKIGPRGAAGAGEARAAHYIAEVAKGYTHQVWTEPFRSFTSAAWPWCLILSLALAGGVALYRWPEAGALLAGLAAVCFAAQANGRIQLGWLFSRRGSQNVIAVIPSEETIHERVVLVSHYDTAKVLPRLKPVPSPQFRQAFLAVASCVAALPCLALGEIVFPGRGWGWMNLLPLLSIAVAAAALLYWEVCGTYEPGALNNGSGVAVSLLAGERLARAPLPHTEVWVVFTGCKEAGLTGMHALLDRHGTLLADAHFIVLEQIGSGPLAYSADECLLDLARQVTREHPEWSLTASRRTPQWTDAAAALSRGYRAMAVLSVERPSYTRWSAAACDRIERLDPAVLETAVQFVVALARRFDGRGSRAAGTGVRLPEQGV